MIALVGAIGLALITAALILTTRRADAKRILEEQFATAIEPDGPFTPCRVQFPVEEAPARFVVRATKAGWYMATPAEVLAKQSWLLREPVLREPVLIPWSQLEIRPARFGLSLWWLRFEVPASKVTFFVQKNVAMKLLSEAERPVPSESHPPDPAR